ncbi:MAG: hypothetical protein H6620_05945 [Halobacteriovoraceae bacterium]|nr:hypothetical protein [Halobacteriovoraceae bacterium]
MEDIRSIINHHLPKRQVDGGETEKKPRSKKATTSEIPDLFFDEILVSYKLNRIEIMVLMYLYRLVWCKPNIHRDYGIGPILSYEDLMVNLVINQEDLYQALRKLETYEFIETIKSGQFFVRKYFTRENDRLYGQRYDDFL